MKEYDVIVVGGGLAGLTSAAFLCRAGHRTLLLEKSGQTGGLVKTFWHGGYAFDAGIRAFENSGILFPMLKRLGLDLEFTKNPVSIGIASHKTALLSPASLDDYAAMLGEIFPEHREEIVRIFREIHKVMGYMDVLYGIDNPLFLDDYKDLGYVTKTLLPWLLRYQINIRRAARLNEPVTDYLRHFTDNQALIDLIVQHFFKGTPTSFALSYFGQYLDYSYPRGGTGRLAEAVTEYIRQQGGEIRTGVAVVGIDAEKHEIATDKGEAIGFRKLVWAADQKYFYENLSGAASPALTAQRELTQAAGGGDSILTLFIGSDLAPDYYEARCGAHMFYTPELLGLSSLPPWETAAKAGTTVLWDWIGQYLERTTFEVSCPALRDPALAPAGKTGLVISTLMDYRLARHLEEAGAYGEFKAYCTDKITQILEDTIFPGLKTSTEFALCATPLTLLKETGNSDGAITGWAFTNSHLPAEQRFPKIADSVRTPVPDVFQCGQWTFSPAGLPVSILTGKLAADAVGQALRAKS